MENTAKQKELAEKIVELLSGLSVKESHYILGIALDEANRQSKVVPISR